MDTLGGEGTTTLWDVTQVCAVCGASNSVRVIGSRSSCGSMMDGRPIAMGIDPLGEEVKVCHVCGYCSVELARDFGVSREDLDDGEYRRALEAGERHRCYAMLLSRTGDHQRSSVMYLHAAWTHDDRARYHRFDLRKAEDRARRAECARKAEREAEEARALRSLAVRELEMCTPRGVGDRIVMADMLRCAGRLEEARAVAETALRDPRGMDLHPVVRQEIAIIDAGITEPGSMSGGGEDDGPRLVSMKLDSGPFRAISEGRKAYELRLNDRKRSRIRPGDLIEFTDWKTSEVMYADVTEVLRFSSFDELYASVDNRLLDPDNPDPKPSDMEKYYSRESQAESGVLAIGVRPHPVPEGWREGPEPRRSMFRRLFGRYRTQISPEDARTRDGDSIYGVSMPNHGMRP